MSNPTITYHRLSAENAPLLEGAEAFDYPVDPAQLTAFVADPGHELVFARIGSRVIGIASGNVLLHPDKAPAFFINEVGVEEDMQRQGIATELTERLLDIARAKGCKGIWLATEEDNTAARSLYAKLKATETRAIVVYDWDGTMET